MRPAYRRSRRKAHPRSRGENQTHTRVRQTTGGSSPLTRGKPLTQFKLSGSDGLIPAHAGKTSRPRLRSRRQRAHPRSRGENVEGGHFRPFRWGSSPLTRGKRSRLWKWCRRRRLIPAHAGKTTREVTEPARRRAHPRSRGENTLTSTGTSVKAGSSPLTRGKPWNGLDDNGNPGLIPAHAGKTTGQTAVRGGDWAHPRSRGENVLQCRRTSRLQGSSPLTRGKLHDARQERHRPRLIPAHAGKTCCP